MNQGFFSKFSDFINATQLRKEIWSWFKTIVGAIILAWLIKTFIIVNAVVPTGSMETTIMPGERLIAFRLSYIFSEPERYDIIVFKYPDDRDTLYIKRIIGMPGETIDITGGKVYVDAEKQLVGKTFNGTEINSVSIDNKNVYINGGLENGGIEVNKEDILSKLITPLEDSFIKEPMKPEPYEHNTHYVIPENSYFMLGDNRNDSWDSRCWTNTFVPESDILGKAVVRYYKYYDDDDDYGITIDFVKNN